MIPWILFAIVYFLMSILFYRELKDPQTSKVWLCIASIVWPVSLTLGIILGVVNKLFGVIEKLSKIKIK